MHLAIFSDSTKSDFPDAWADQSALVLFANAKIDLTRHPMDSCARLNVFSIFGAAKIIVPAGTRVVTGGVAHLRRGLGAQPRPRSARKSTSATSPSSAASKSSKPSPRRWRSRRGAVFPY